jgi:hypothetical protein
MNIANYIEKEVNGVPMALLYHHTSKGEIKDTNTSSRVNLLKIRTSERRKNLIPIKQFSQ